MHSLRRGGATNFFRVTGNLSATLERGRWISVSSGRIYITEGLSVMAHRKIEPTTAEKLIIASEALPGRGALEAATLNRNVRSRQGQLRRAPRVCCSAMTETSGDLRMPKIMCAHKSALPSSPTWGRYGRWRDDKGGTTEEEPLYVGE